MRKIIVDLNVVKDNEFSMMYEMFGLDVQNKSQRSLPSASS